MLLQIIYPTYPFSVSRNWIKYNLSLLTFSELVHHMVSRNFQSRIPHFPALINQSERVLVYCLKKFGKLYANSRTILTSCWSPLIFWNIHFGIYFKLKKKFSYKLTEIFFQCSLKFFLSSKSWTEKKFQLVYNWIFFQF